MRLGRANREAVLWGFACMAAVVFLVIGGCADKPGARYVQEPSGLTTNNADGTQNRPSSFSLDDPSGTKNVVYVDAEGNRSIMGGLHTQTSEATGSKLSEANTGGAPQQRAVVTIGNIKALLSTAADWDWHDVDAMFEDEKLVRLRIGSLSTLTSPVQKAVNDGVAIEVQAWIAGTQADRDVQLERLKTQAQGVGAGAEVAKAVLPILSKLAGVP